MNNKLEIYFVHTCLGKTYFCQHNTGWFDLDISMLLGGMSAKTCINIIEKYSQYGYKFLVSATRRMIYMIGKYVRARTHSGLVVYLPEHTQEAYNFYIKNTEQRGYPRIKKEIKKFFRNIEEIENLLTEEDTIIYIPTGKYFSDIFN